MEIVCDRRAELIGLSGVLLLCRLRLYREGERFVALISEVEENTGASVTNASEYIASQVLSLFGLRPEQVTWIEHYPVLSWRQEEAESFDLVRYTVLAERRPKVIWGPRCGMACGDLYLSVDDPDWLPYTKEQTETLIGHVLP